MKKTRFNEGKVRLKVELVKHDRKELLNVINWKMNINRLGNFIEEDKFIEKNYNN